MGLHNGGNRLSSIARVSVGCDSIFDLKASSIPLNPVLGSRSTGSGSCVGLFENPRDASTIAKKPVPYRVGCGVILSRNADMSRSMTSASSGWLFWMALSMNP